MAKETKPIKIERIDNSDGTYTVKIFYAKPRDEYTNAKLFIYVYDKFDRLLNLKIYLDIEQNKLISESIYNYNENGTYELKIINDSKNVYSTIKYDKNNFLLERTNYADKYFTEQLSHIIYEYNEFEKKEYVTCKNDGYNSQIDIYDIKNDRIKTSTYYSDDNFNNFYGEEKYNYKQDGSYTKNIVYTQPIRNCLSVIKFYDKNGKSYQSVAYSDNSFKNIFYKSKIKHLKSGNRIYYRTYVKSENGIYAEIEKFDKEGISLYKKQYKFKGTFAHILFWLAR